MAKLTKNDTSAMIDVGQPAPPFNLPDQNGTVHHVGGAGASEASSWTVLYFYPKDDTSGCTKQACGFRDADAALRDAGLLVLGVSPDNEKSHGKFAKKYALPFPLLADVGATVCTAYGVWQQKSMYGRKYMGVVRTTYLIDPAGRVAHRWDQVKVDGHAEDVLAVARRAMADG